jgi:atypical dual specificity phosphatase
MHRQTTTAALVALSLCFSAAGCDSPVLTMETEVQVQAQVQVEAPRRFSWVIDDQLAGMAHPGLGDAAQASYDYLDSRDVTLLVSLTEHLPQATGLADRGIDHLHLPVVDYTAPTLEQLDDFVTLTSAELWRGGRVTVHCAGGRGRTGTFLAAWFVAGGMSAAEAIEHVRALRPGSIETTCQLDVIAEYADLLQ